MDYTIAVCDDSDADRNFIAGLVQRWAAERGRAARVDLFASAENFLFCAADSGGCDILLLDIEMPGMDGVELAKRIRDADETVQIVFITGYSDYIEQGYEVEALHFLLKPVKPEKLMEVLDRAAARLQKAERVLSLDTGGELVRVPMRQIRFAEVRSNYVTVHAKEDLTCKMTLSELEKLLDERFLRVGRSYIVNLTAIARVTRTDIFLRDGAQIPLPRGAYEAVNRAIISMEGTHGTV